MTIYLLDYAAAELLRIHVHEKTQKVIEDKYNGDVEDYLNDHEDFFGVRMSDCHFMVVDDDIDFRDFEI